MGWSWKLGTVAGIPIRVDFTFAVLMGFIAVQHWIAGHTVAMAVYALAFIGAVFACILLHELGHAFMARRYGIQTKDITLLPIGGLARLERVPEVPREEIAVALAGPAVNVVIAAALYGVLWVQGAMRPLSELGLATGPFLERLMLTNVVLVAFNMIPALPMDGGRVFRALLAERMDRARATHIASKVATGIAIVFAVVGLFVNLWLLVIALFVWLGAVSESTHTTTKSVLAGVQVEQAMVRDFKSLNILDTPEDAVNAVINGSQRDFPVMHGERFVGVLLQQDLLQAMSSDPQPMHIGQIMRRECITFVPGEAMTEVFPKVLGSDQGCFPVMLRGQVIGLLTMQNILEFVAFRRAVQQRGAIAA